MMSKRGEKEKLAEAKVIGQVLAATAFAKTLFRVDGPCADTEGLGGLSRTMFRDGDVQNGVHGWTNC